MNESSRKNEEIFLKPEQTQTQAQAQAQTQTQNTIGDVSYSQGHIASTLTEAYNPNQDKREVLEIRRSYAHLREELTKNSRELVQADSNRLSELIDQSNIVFNRVHTTFDASLDSRFITDTADLGVEKVHKLPLFVSEFSLDSYLQIIKRYLKSCSYEDMGNLISSHWIGVDTPDFMLGSMNLDVKIRANNPNQPNRVAKETVAAVVKPTVVDLAKKQNDPEEMSKETSENVIKVFNVLSNIGSFPFYHFITDPQSLGRTIENLFYVSFLIRDHRARIFIPEFAAESNELYIEAIYPDDENEPDLADASNQLILVMSAKTWRKAIEKYKIEKAFLNFLLS